MLQSAEVLVRYGGGITWDDDGRGVDLTALMGARRAGAVNMRMNRMRLCSFTDWIRRRSLSRDFDVRDIAPFRGLLIDDAVDHRLVPLKGPPIASAKNADA